MLSGHVLGPDELPDLKHLEHDKRAHAKGSPISFRILILKLSKRMKIMFNRYVIGSLFACLKY